jgi:hypothetical protein
MSDFGPVTAHALTERERNVVEALFGSGVLPEDSIVEVHNGNLIIEHFNLDRFLELFPDLDPRLIGSGRLHYQIEPGAGDSHAIKP